MPYNLNIPGWMPETELKTIELIAQTIPRDGKMVEIGPFCGRSTWCWARSADPSVTVHCLDIWNPAEHPFHPPATIGCDQTIKADFGAATELAKVRGTLDNFKYYTSDCLNVVAHKGASPRDFKYWDEPLDLVFLDGVHHNPIFQQDLNFWFWKLKPGGMSCGDDFSRTHPDVVWGVQDFAKAHGLTFLVQGRIWMMPRPPHRPIPTSLFGNQVAIVPDAGSPRTTGFHRRKLRRECSAAVRNTLSSRTGWNGLR